VKVFADANVLVSAAATRGLCADVLREILTSHDLVLSRQVLEEVRRALRLKFRAATEAVADYVRLLEEEGVIAEPGPLPDVDIEDKDDLPILAAAVAAGAHVLVTGDKELQDIGRIDGVRILSPREFWEKLRSGRQRP
jgi:putative PIN family toxin of toxin-antitoxin system